MKKRIARIQRWIDRMNAACENKKWESALMEADCLSAEVRESREKLLAMTESTLVPEKPRMVLPFLSMAVKSVGIAALIICCATVPASVEADRPWLASAPKPAAEVRAERENLRWITPEEEDLLKMIRADMDRLEPIQQAAKPQEIKPQTMPTRNAVRPGSSQITVTEKRAVKEISDEDLIALLQIGSKALRTNSPAVKIIN